MFQNGRIVTCSCERSKKFRVQELVKKIESHLYREALEAGVQQSNANNPYSEKSKKMNRDMGNTELLRVLTILEVVWSKCFLYWQSLVDASSDGNCQLNFLSVANCVIKKGRFHGNRRRKFEEQRDFVIRNSELTELKNMRPDGRGGAERFYLSHLGQPLSTHVTKCTDEIPIRLAVTKMHHLHSESSCTDSLLAASEMASVVFSIKHIMVAVERFLVEFVKIHERQAPLSS